MITCLNKLALNWDIFLLFLGELWRENQERLTVAVKEDEYWEVLWDGIDKIGSCRERMLRSW